jgi:regulator of protease activity HflC (stomatin/prohibitin superfamily)
MTSLVVIEPHQRALVLSFGSPSAPVMSFGDRDGDEIGPGLHVVLPWPMTEIYVPQTESADGSGAMVKTSTGVRVLRLGTNPPKADEDILWTNEHTVQEKYSLVQKAREGIDSDPSDADDLTSLSLVAVEVPVQYVIEDVRAFDELAQPEHRDTLMDVLGERMMMQYLATQRIDQILGAGRVELSRGIAARLSETLNSVPGVDGEPRHAGIRLLDVGVAGVHPPKDAAPYFERVVHAGQLREAKVEAAREYAARKLNSVAAPIEREDGTEVGASEIVAMIEELDAMSQAGATRAAIAEQEVAIQRLLEEAGGEAGAALIEAGAGRWKRHMSERGKAALYQGQLASFEAAPALYMTSAYFDALLAVMRDSRVYLTGERITQLNVNLNLEDRETNLELFDPEAGSDQ